MCTVKKGLPWMGPRKRKLNVLSPRLAPQGHGLAHKSTFLNDEVAAEMIDDRWPVTPKSWCRTSSRDSVDCHSQNITFSQNASVLSSTTGSPVFYRTREPLLVSSYENERPLLPSWPILYYKLWLFYIWYRLLIIFLTSTHARKWNRLRGKALRKLLWGRRR